MEEVINGIKNQQNGEIIHQRSGFCPMITFKNLKQVVYF
jgi:hypothetical protein